MDQDLEKSLLGNKKDEKKEPTLSEDDDLYIPRSLTTTYEKVRFLFAYCVCSLLFYSVYFNIYNAHWLGRSDNSPTFGGSVASTYDISILCLSRVFFILNSLFYSFYISWWALSAFPPNFLSRGSEFFVSWLHFFVEVLLWFSVVWIIFGGLIILFLYTLSDYVIMCTVLSVEDVWNLRMP